MANGEKGKGRSQNQRLPYFILPDRHHLLGFLPSLCGREFRRGIPSRTLENLLAIAVPTHASLEFEGNNLLPF